ncbi:hypothetical protein GCM10007924_10000 [Sneathiella chinensis]|uniref:Uncharacterized protein n=1 Tax=Sneathiella chinensis TaxID=349750 RepID=A0ABQ5U0U4_9PROT|nr:hypothetical protein GCM10007924_10000 [Sneathiella chinensis]
MPWATVAEQDDIRNLLLVQRLFKKALKLRGLVREIYFMEAVPEEVIATVEIDFGYSTPIVCKSLSKTQEKGTGNGLQKEKGSPAVLPVGIGVFPNQIYKPVSRVTLEYGVCRSLSFRRRQDNK